MHRLISYINLVRMRMAGGRVRVVHMAGAGMQGGGSVLKYVTWPEDASEWSIWQEPECKGEGAY